MELEGRLIDIAGSVGVATTRDPSHDPADLLRAADTAMYAAKVRGRHRFELSDVDAARLAGERSHHDG
jgi:PleD family two-component response regulator